MEKIPGNPPLDGRAVERLGADNPGMTLAGLPGLADRSAVQGLTGNP